MSVDRSLKSRNSLQRHRNVLTRAERLAKLLDEERWEEGRDPILGLPKVAHRKSTAGKKVKKEKTEEVTEEGAALTDAPAPAPEAASE